MNLIRKVFLITLMASAVFVIAISSARITTAIQRGVKSEQESMEEASLTGISQQDRKQIYTDLVEAGEKAKLDADKIHPTDPLHPNYKKDNAVKNLDMLDTLGNEYKTEVRDKWGITEGQQRLIIGEHNTGATIPIKQQSSTGITESLPDKGTSLPGIESLPRKQPTSVGVTKSRPGEGSSLPGVESPSEEENSVEKRQAIQDESLEYE